MTRDWPSASELKVLKRSDPDRYRAVLAKVISRPKTCVGVAFLLFLASIACIWISMKARCRS